MRVVLRGHNRLDYIGGGLIVALAVSLLVFDGNRAFIDYSLFFTGFLLACGFGVLGDRRTNQ